MCRYYLIMAFKLLITIIHFTYAAAGDRCTVSTGINKYKIHLNEYIKSSSHMIPVTNLTSLSNECKALNVAVKSDIDLDYFNFTILLTNEDNVQRVTTNSNTNSQNGDDNKNHGNITSPENAREEKGYGGDAQNFKKKEPMNGGKVFAIVVMSLVATVAAFAICLFVIKKTVLYLQSGSYSIPQAPATNP